MDFMKFLLIFLALNLFLQPINSLQFLSSSNSLYDPNKAKEFWYLSLVSYCSQSNIQAWKVSIVSDLYPNIQDIAVFSSSSSSGENFGFSAYDRDNNLIFVAIRGSSNIPNWFENLDTIQISYDKCNECKVHQGFSDAYSSLKEGILSSVQNLHRKYPNAQIAVLGHSLGAAIATLAFVDLFQSIGNIDYFYTFGSPRVGNKNFADFVNSIASFGYNFKARVTHHEDPVPHLPLREMGFFHINTEIFYNEDSSSFTNCDSGEDPNCSIKFLIIPDISDHLDYMGFAHSELENKC